MKDDLIKNLKNLIADYENGDMDAEDVSGFLADYSKDAFAIWEKEQEGAANA